MDAVAIVSIIAVGASIVVWLVANFFPGRIQSVSIAGVKLELREVEDELLRTIAEGADDAEIGTAATWADLEEGVTPDPELRRMVGHLAGRVKRLESVSERIEIRRQALLETYHNQGLSQSRVSLVSALL